MQDLLATGREIVLLYGNRNRDSIAFNAEFRDIAARQPRLCVVHVLSLDPGWGGEEGLIDKEKITRLAPDVAERDVYLCGPPPMMAGVMRDLKALGVPRQRIFYERFTL